MDAKVREVFARLNSASTVEAEDAKAELTQRGPDLLPALVAAVPSFGRFAKLSAIEILEEWGDPAAGPALTGLLDDDGCTVQEWAALALAALDYRAAVPALLSVRRRLIHAGQPPAWSQSTAVRYALTALGHRHPVLPSRSRSLASSAGPLLWPAVHLTEVVDDLADHGQVVLYWQAWRERRTADGHTSRHWENHEGLDWNYDPTKPWTVNVREAREAALLEAAIFGEPVDLVVELEWIDQDDVTAS